VAYTPSHLRDKIRTAAAGKRTLEDERALVEVEEQW
jgi:hypothetical protein